MLTKETDFRHFLATAILLATLIIHILIARFVPQFLGVFDRFGAELPLITQLFLPGSLVYWVLPLAGVAAYLIYWIRPKPGLNILAFCAVGSILMVPATIAAMYLPVYMLGAVIEP